MIKPALFVSCKPRVCVSVCLSSCPAACISVFASLRNKGDVLLILGFTFIRALLYQFGKCAGRSTRLHEFRQCSRHIYIQDGRNERKAFKSVHIHTLPLHVYALTHIHIRIYTHVHCMVQIHIHGPMQMHTNTHEQIYTCSHINLHS